MLLSYPEYQDNYIKISLLLKETFLPEITNNILYLRHLVTEAEIKPIEQFPRLALFHLNLISVDKIYLEVKESKLRRIIHEFCEQHHLLSRSDYSVSEILKRQCLGCNNWSEEKMDDWAKFWCEHCQECFGYWDEYDDIWEMIDDKEIRCKFACQGEMLVMKRNNIIPNYKQNGNYRKWRRHKNKK